MEMKFDEYLTETGMTIAEFATRMGCSVQTLYKYRNGTRFPHRAAQRQIFLLTGGRVTPNDWVGVTLPGRESHAEGGEVP